jgi:uncharacterized sporulation protein YeaH/YhbH (DUF444 family)
MHIVDRRLNPRGKSLENRQRFLRRAKSLVQRAVRQSSENRGIEGVLQGGEVTIPLDGLDEPRLRRGGDGIADQVLPGNKEFIEGDILPRSRKRGGKPKDAGEGANEDAFRFVLTREEFLDLFLDDLELPDLAKRRLAEGENETPRRAGYSVSGSPANIAVNRTMRLALARRVALRRPHPEAIEKLKDELAECENEDCRDALTDQITALERRIKRIPYIDPVDIRYRRFEMEPKPVAQAVMFCLMDVSGSMSEHMKDLAKRFYMLLYVFLTRRYRHVEIVFIRHTDEAEEVDEETFFRSPATGGTLVSSALEAMRQIIVERYNPRDWNIYGAQASDGDNSDADSAETERLLNGAILPVSQYFAYLEVGESESGSTSGSTLWQLYESMRLQGAILSMRKVSRRSEIFSVFRELFERRSVPERANP